MQHKKNKYNLLMHRTVKIYSPADFLWNVGGFITF